MLDLLNDARNDAKLKYEILPFSVAIFMHRQLTDDVLKIRYNCEFNCSLMQCYAKGKINVSFFTDAFCHNTVFQNKKKISMG